MKKISLCLFVFMCQIALGQTFVEKEIQGKIIVADSTFAEGVNIKNESNGVITSSNDKGVFVIRAKESDVLVFSAVNLVTLYKQILEEDFRNKIFKVTLVLKNSVLDEVVINAFPNITAENLGIISQGQKKYSPAERKLNAARSGLLDRPLNWISGRTAMLKKEVEVEKKEQDLQRLSYLFENKYYVENLGIPLDYIRGFQYYCLGNQELINSLHSKNKTMTMFLIVSLSEKYKTIISYEN